MGRGRNEYEVEWRWSTKDGHPSVLARTIGRAVEAGGEGGIRKGEGLVSAGVGPPVHNAHRREPPRRLTVGGDSTHVVHAKKGKLYWEAALLFKAIHEKSTVTHADATPQRILALDVSHSQNLPRDKNMRRETHSN